MTSNSNDLAYNQEQSAVSPQCCFTSDVCACTLRGVRRAVCLNTDKPSNIEQLRATVGQLLRCNGVSELWRCLLDPPCFVYQIIIILIIIISIIIIIIIIPLQPLQPLPSRLSAAVSCYHCNRHMHASELFKTM